MPADSGMYVNRIYERLRTVATHTSGGLSTQAAEMTHHFPLPLFAPTQGRHHQHYRRQPLPPGLLDESAFAHHFMTPTTLSAQPPPLPSVHHLPPRGIGRPIAEAKGSAAVGHGLTRTVKHISAQPRRAVRRVPPRGIGPIDVPNRNDVLFGRGRQIHAHEGDIKFRKIVAANKEEYLSQHVKKLEKADIVARVVVPIRTRRLPRRFLKEDIVSGMWYDIGDATAMLMAGRALRKDAPYIRDEIEDENRRTSLPPTSPSA